jgi:phospholipase/carboxylesterase
VTERYFKHLYQPPPGADRRTLLLLHGPAGDEHELLPLASLLWPTAGILSPRGQLDVDGEWHFFRRFEGGTCDLGDLERRATQLAQFVAGAARVYRFEPREVVAVGYSDGATLASTLLVGNPEVLAGAVLFRSATPCMPERIKAVPGTPVLLAGGSHDPVITPEDTGDIAGMLRVAGATVTVSLQPAARQIVPEDVEQAREWLTSCGTLRSPLRMS